jgi:hypothetical protein
MFLSVCKYGAHCIAKYCTVRNIPTHCITQYCTVRNIPTHCITQYCTCAMFPPVCEYCAHCITQYCTLRNVPISMRILRPLYHSTLHLHNVPISMRILRPLHHSILHCAQCSYQYASTAPTISLNTVLCAIFPPTVSVNTALCAIFPSACEYCAHCITQYCTVHSVPISIQILRTLHPPNTLLCAMCPLASPNCPHRTDLLHTAPAVTQVRIHKEQNTEYVTAKDRPLTVIRNYIQALKSRNSLIVTNFDKLLEALPSFKL